jgi:hypothetical protein
VENEAAGSASQPLPKLRQRRTSFSLLPANFWLSRCHPHQPSENMPRLLSHVLTSKASAILITYLGTIRPQNGRAVTTMPEGFQQGYTRATLPVAFSASQEVGLGPWRARSLRLRRSAICTLCRLDRRPVSPAVFPTLAACGSSARVRHPYSPFPAPSWIVVVTSFALALLASGQSPKHTRNVALRKREWFVGNPRGATVCTSLGFAIYHIHLPSSCDTYSEPRRNCSGETNSGVLLQDNCRLLRSMSQEKSRDKLQDNRSC